MEKVNIGKSTYTNGYGGKTINCSTSDNVTNKLVKKVEALEAAFKIAEQAGKSHERYIKALEAENKRLRDGIKEIRSSPLSNRVIDLMCLQLLADKGE